MNQQEFQLDLTEQQNHCQQMQEQKPEIKLDSDEQMDCLHPSEEPEAVTEQSLHHQPVWKDLHEVLQDGYVGTWSRLSYPLPHLQAC